MKSPDEIEKSFETWLDSSADCTCSEPELGQCWYHADEKTRLFWAYTSGFWAGELARDT